MGTPIEVSTHKVEYRLLSLLFCFIRIAIAIVMIDRIDLRDIGDLACMGRHNGPLGIILITGLEWEAFLRWTSQASPRG